MTVSARKSLGSSVSEAEELIGVLPPRAASLPQYLTTAMFVGASADAMSKTSSGLGCGGGGGTMVEAAPFDARGVTT